jgi:hypothetical protein
MTTNENQKKARDLNVHSLDVRKWCSSIELPLIITTSAIRIPSATAQSTINSFRRMNSMSIMGHGPIAPQNEEKHA